MNLRKFVKDLQATLGQAAAQRSLQLGKGQCKDMQEYKRAVGFIEGLNGAGDIAEQMLRAIEDHEREGDLPEMPPAGAGSE